MVEKIAKKGILCASIGMLTTSRLHAGCNRIAGECDEGGVGFVEAGNLLLRGKPIEPLS